MFAFACVQPTLRGAVCEELLRQPELMRSLIDAGLTIENCDVYFERGVIGVVGIMSVLLICRVSVKHNNNTARLIHLFRCNSPCW